MKLSYSAALNALEKRLAQLSTQYKRQASSDEGKATLEYEISMALQSLTKIQDQIMNDIYQKYGTPPLKEKTPYFSSADTKDKLIEDLERAKISNLSQTNPELFEVLEKSTEWVPQARHLANDVHKKFAPIVEQGEDGIGFGRGQNVVIKGTVNSLMDIPKITKAWDPETGKRVPLQIDITRFERLLANTNQDPIQYCMDSLRKVRILAQNVAKHV
jgi:hypothetical protein